MLKQVQCPQCHATLLWGPQSPCRPFCSERCRLIDLGLWAKEHYRFALTEGSTTSDETEAQERSSEDL